MSLQIPAKLYVGKQEHWQSPLECFAIDSPSYYHLASSPSAIKAQCSQKLTRLLVGVAKTPHQFFHQIATAYKDDTEHRHYKTVPKSTLFEKIFQWWVVSKLGRNWVPWLLQSLDLSFQFSKQKLSLPSVMFISVYMVTSQFTFNLDIQETARFPRAERHCQFRQGFLRIFMNE